MTKSSDAHVVTLGTDGGPRWWRYTDRAPRAGISTAVVVGDAYYLVDCGYGAGRQIIQAGLEIANLKAVFLTHLHSDHIADLANLAMFGLYESPGRQDDPIHLVGPGNRGKLPPVAQHAVSTPRPVAPGAPTPGTHEMFDLLVAANATDLNDRIIDSLRPSPHDLFIASDISIPVTARFDPNDNPTPTMQPFPIFEDDRVAVSAILVEHPPMAPAFGFRFETDGGSVTFSGDTAFTENMITLASGTDLLLHEVIDFEWVDSLYADLIDDTSRASRAHHYKSHTGVLDVAKVASESGAKQLALHHRVPGNTAKAIWERAGELYHGKVYVPEDLDSIPICSTNQAPHLV